MYNDVLNGPLGGNAAIMGYADAVAVVAVTKDLVVVWLYSAEAIPWDDDRC